jgi:hypothetical protein
MQPSPGGRGQRKPEVVEIEWTDAKVSVRPPVERIQQNIKMGGVRPRNYPAARKRPRNKAPQRAAAPNKNQGAHASFTEWNTDTSSVGDKLGIVNVPLAGRERKRKLFKRGAMDVCAHYNEAWYASCGACSALCAANADTRKLALAFPEGAKQWVQFGPLADAGPATVLFFAVINVLWMSLALCAALQLPSLFVLATVRGERMARGTSMTAGMTVNAFSMLDLVDSTIQSGTARSVVLFGFDIDMRWLTLGMSVLDALGAVMLWTMTLRLFRLVKTINLASQSGRATLAEYSVLVRNLPNPPPPLQTLAEHFEGLYRLDEHGDWLDAEGCCCTKVRKRDLPDVQPFGDPGELPGVPDPTVLGKDDFPRILATADAKVTNAPIGAPDFALSDNFQTGWLADAVYVPDLSLPLQFAAQLAINVKQWKQLTQARVTSENQRYCAGTARSLVLWRLGWNEKAREALKGNWRHKSAESLNPHPVAALITFNNIESRTRALADHSCSSRLGCCCCQPKSMRLVLDDPKAAQSSCQRAANRIEMSPNACCKELRVSLCRLGGCVGGCRVADKKKWALSVHPAPAPEVVNWSNLKLSDSARACQKVVSLLTFVVLVAVSTTAVIAAEVWNPASQFQTASLVSCNVVFPSQFVGKLGLWATLHPAVLHTPTGLCETSQSLAQCQGGNSPTGASTVVYTASVPSTKRPQCKQALGSIVNPYLSRMTGIHLHLESYNASQSFRWNPQASSVCPGASHVATLSRISTTMWAIRVWDRATAFRVPQMQDIVAKCIVPALHRSVLPTDWVLSTAGDEVLLTNPCGKACFLGGEQDPMASTSLCANSTMTPTLLRQCACVSWMMNGGFFEMGDSAMSLQHPDIVLSEQDPLGSIRIEAKRLDQSLCATTVAAMFLGSFVGNIPALALSVVGAIVDSAVARRTAAEGFASMEDEQVTVVSRSTLIQALNFLTPIVLTLRVPGLSALNELLGLPGSSFSVASIDWFQNLGASVIWALVVSLASSTLTMVGGPIVEAIRMRYVQRCSRTQAELQEKLEPVEFNMIPTVSVVLFMVFTIELYRPAYPMLPFFGAVVLLAAYWGSMIRLVRFNKPPSVTSAKLFATAPTFLLVLVVVRCVLAMFLNADSSVVPTWFLSEWYPTTTSVTSLIPWSDRLVSLPHAVVLVWMLWHHVIRAMLATLFDMTCGALCRSCSLCQRVMKRNHHSLNASVDSLNPPLCGEYWVPLGVDVIRPHPYVLSASDVERGWRYAADMAGGTPQWAKVQVFTKAEITTRKHLLLATSAVEDPSTDEVLVPRTVECPSMTVSTGTGLVRADTKLHQPKLTWEVIASGSLPTFDVFQLPELSEATNLWKAWVQGAKWGKEHIVLSGLWGLQGVLRSRSHSGSSSMTRVTHLARDEVEQDKKLVVEAQPMPTSHKKWKTSRVKPVPLGTGLKFWKVDEDESLEESSPLQWSKKLSVKTAGLAVAAARQLSNGEMSLEELAQ